jgi:peptidoglycan/LPS O-acetylase OafA/YrhL
MESLREGLPVVLGACVPLLGEAVAALGLRRRRRLVMAVLVVAAGVTASAVNGELASWPEGAFAIVVDTILAGLAALVCMRLLRRWSAARAAASLPPAE